MLRQLSSCLTIFQSHTTPSLYGFLTLLLRTYTVKKRKPGQRDRENCPYYSHAFISALRFLCEPANEVSDLTRVGWEREGAAAVQEDRLVSNMMEDQWCFYCSDTALYWSALHSIVLNYCSITCQTDASSRRQTSKYTYRYIMNTHILYIYTYTHR